MMFLWLSQLPPLVTGSDSFQHHFSSFREHTEGLPFKVPNLKDIFPALPRHPFDHSWVGMWCGRQTNFYWTGGIRTHVTGIRQQQDWPLRPLCYLPTPWSTDALKYWWADWGEALMVTELMSSSTDEPALCNVLSFYTHSIRVCSKTRMLRHTSFKKHRFPTINLWLAWHRATHWEKMMLIISCVIDTIENTFFLTALTIFR